MMQASMPCNYVGAATQDRRWKTQPPDVARLMLNRRIRKTLRNWRRLLTRHRARETLDRHPGLRLRLHRMGQRRR